MGDYAADTQHLSWDEDCAYRRLLDQYYKREVPIPADLRQACRLARAVSKPQRRAVETVLREFFDLRDDGWHQKRCDAEIGRADAASGSPLAADDADSSGGAPGPAGGELTRSARHKARRREMFAALDARGVVLPRNASMDQLQDALVRVTTGGAASPVSPAASPEASPVSPSATVTPSPEASPGTSPLPSPSRPQTDTRLQTPDTEKDAHPHPQAHPPAPVPPPAPERTSTPAGEACRAMRAAGLPDANPSHPRLIALLAAGMTVPELEDAARTAADRGAGFTYALSTAEGRRRDAARVGPLPPAPPPGAVHGRAAPAASFLAAISNPTLGASHAAADRRPFVDADARVVA